MTNDTYAQATAMNKEEPYFTINELAKTIHRNRNTIWRWIADGKLKSSRFGAEHRILYRDWEESLAAFQSKTLKAR